MKYYIGLLLLPLLSSCVEEFNVQKGAVAPAAPYVNKGIVTTIAGTLHSVGNVLGQGTNTKFDCPWGLVTDGSGNIYVSDNGSRQIKKIDSQVNVTLFAGSGNSGTTDGAYNVAEFGWTGGITRDSLGNFYVGDYMNKLVRKIAPNGDVTTFAGTAGVSGSADGTGTAATFFYPDFMTMDKNNNLYVSDAHAIRKITPAGVVTTFAGNVTTSGYVNANGTAARFNNVKGMAFDSQGNLFVSDSNNHIIRKITPAGDVSLYAGTQGVFGHLEGTLATALLRNPYGMTIDENDNLYFADNSNTVITKITPAGIVSTFAGDGVYAHADGVGVLAEFEGVYNITYDRKTGYFYTTDCDSNVIRKIE